MVIFRNSRASHSELLGWWMPQAGSLVSTSDFNFPLCPDAFEFLDWSGRTYSLAEPSFRLRILREGLGGSHIFDFEPEISIFAGSLRSLRRETRFPFVCPLGIQFSTSYIEGSLRREPHFRFRTQDVDFRWKHSSSEASGGKRDFNTSAH